MALHPLAEQFASVAGAYERGRPEYPQAVVAVLASELQLEPGGRVADLAAGTGKLTRALLAAGLDVVGVEPQASLRERLAAGVGHERALDGLAEAIPLADASVAAVTVADAFHWFDQAAALAEIRRVLRPRGSLAVVTTLADWSMASWGHELGTLVQRARPEHPHFDGPPWRESIAAAGGWSAPREIHLSAPQPANRQQILDYVTSMSWVAALGERPRAELLAQAGSLLDAEEMPDELGVRVVVGLTTLL